MRTGHAPQAASALEELLKKRPGLKPAQLLLADAYRASGRLDDAANIFTEQIKLTPTAPELYFFLGLIQQQQQKNPQAKQSFEKVLELSPENLLAVSQLIDLDLQTKDFDDANRRVQQQLEKHPDAAISYLFEGKVRMAQRNLKEAETALKKTLELDANLAPAYDMLVTIYLSTNRLPEAAHELEMVLVKAPKNGSALMTLAVIKEKQKDYPKAGDTYEKLLALNPNFIPALNNLSYLYAEQLNQLDKANDLAQKARQLDPSNASVAEYSRLDPLQTR